MRIEPHITRSEIYLILHLLALTPRTSTGSDARLVPRPNWQRSVRKQEQQTVTRVSSPFPLGPGLSVTLSTTCLDQI